MRKIDGMNERLFPYLECWEAPVPVHLVKYPARLQLPPSRSRDADQAHLDPEVLPEVLAQERQGDTGGQVQSRDAAKIQQEIPGLQRMKKKEKKTLLIRSGKSR